MNEPLKGKRQQKTFYEFGGYNEKDIKSAVEWLKKDLINTYKVFEVPEMFMNIVEKKINKAFEDVTKE